MPQGLKTPLFSVGITAFRRRPLLQETLASVRAQTFGDFEVLVGNDDPLVSLDAAQFGIDDARWRFINHARNMGEIPNMNALLAAAGGRYFLWLADDDCLMPEFFARVYAALKQYTFPPAAVTNFFSGDTYHGSSSLTDAKRQFTGRDFLAEYLSQHVRVVGSCAVIERRVLRDWGGATRLGTSTPLYTDNLLAIKLGLLERIVYLEAPLIFFRTHKLSQSWVSTDAAGYQSAQEALCRESMVVFRHPSLHSSFEWYLYQLLRVWCVSYYYKVLRRSPFSSLISLPGYWRFIWRYSRHLSRYRFTLLVAIGRSTFWLMVDVLKRLGAGSFSGVAL